MYIATNTCNSMHVQSLLGIHRFRSDARHIPQVPLSLTLFQAPLFVSGFAFSA